MSFESNESTWDKRFKARHYHYRDFHEERPITGTLANPSTYVFGTNARAVNIANWPLAGDFTLSSNTYAREVKITCDTQSCWMRIISLNPLYLSLLNQGYSVGEIVGLGVAQYITEVPQRIIVNDQITFYPTYGYSIEYWYDVIGSNVAIWIEGNAEGGE